MNVLILTPDRVGSTLLQRLITIYMLRKGFDKPVINLHELTNGLEKYYNTFFNQEVLGKPKGTEWGYYQSLTQIQHLLSSVDHYKTSRLAHYHIVNRRDTISAQLNFYDYLNKEFFIISCRRENLLEHALSWAIQAHSKKLNVYSIQEKIESFVNIYDTGIECPKEALIKYLQKYKEYIEWSDTYFNIQSYWNYDKDIQNIENYILNLPFLLGENNNWENMFGQSFDNFNACHKLIPDLLLYDTGDSTLVKKFLIDKKKYNQLKGSDWPELENLNASTLSQLPIQVKNDIKNFFPVEISEGKNILSKEITIFLKDNVIDYKKTQFKINDLVEKGILVSNVPIKLQTFQEKKRIIKNFDDCVDWYNEWVETNHCGKPFASYDKDNSPDKKFISLEPHTVLLK